MDISVIIASWNSAAVISRAISSALAQVDVALEVIVCDDASTDSTRNLVLGFGDPRVRYVCLSSNSGPAAARNAGLRIAQGEWILILDADDYMAPDRAARLITLGIRTNSDIVVDNMFIVGPSGHVTGKLIGEVLDEKIEVLELERYIRGNILFGPPGLGYLKPILRRSFLVAHEISYPESLRNGEDYAIIVEMLSAGARFVRIKAALYYYVVHESSTSHRANSRHLENLLEFDLHVAATMPRAREQGVHIALSLHIAALRKMIAFTQMVNHLKEHDFKGFFRRAVSHPTALALFSHPFRVRMKRMIGRLPWTPTGARS